GDVQRGLVVPHAQVLNVIAVLVDIVRVRRRQPRVEEQVVTALAGQRGEDGADFGGFHLYGVALVLEHDLPHVAGGLTLGPAAGNTDRDRFALVGAVVTVIAVAALTGVAAAGGKSEGERGGGGHYACNTSLHAAHVFLSWGQ